MVLPFVLRTSWQRSILETFDNCFAERCSQCYSWRCLLFFSLETFTIRPKRRSRRIFLTRWHLPCWTTAMASRTCVEILFFSGKSDDNAQPPLGTCMSQNSVNWQWENNVRRICPDLDAQRTQQTFFAWKLFDEELRACCGWLELPVLLSVALSSPWYSADCDTQHSKQQSKSHTQKHTDNVTRFLFNPRWLSDSLLPDGLQVKTIRHLAHRIQTPWGITTDSR